MVQFRGVKDCYYLVELCVKSVYFVELCTSIKGLLLLSFVIIIEFCVVLLYAHTLVLGYIICT